MLSQMAYDRFMWTEKGIKLEFNLYLLHILLKLSRLLSKENNIKISEVMVLYFS